MKAITDLIPSCVGQVYIRHDEKGDRTVTREAYAAGDRQDSGGAAEHTLRELSPNFGDGRDQAAAA